MNKHSPIVGARCASARGCPRLPREIRAVSLRHVNGKAAADLANRSVWFRHADEKFPLSVIATDVIEFDRDGVVYEKDGVRVVAFEVDHGDVIKPCYGYRFEYGGRAVVLSGDTRYNANVIRYGAGADMLVHEVANARPGLMADAAVRRIIGHHTIPSKAGCVFAQTRPKLAVYTHLVLIGSGKIAPPTVDDVIAETRRPTAGRSWSARI